MSDQDQRAERNDERVEDLEVRGDEAREVAGGKKAEGKAAAKKRAARMNPGNAGGGYVRSSS
jgi:hypothetical protein